MMITHILYCYKVLQVSLTDYYVKISFEGGVFSFFLFMYVIQHCFICRPSDEDAGIKPRPVATLAIGIDSQTL